MNFESMQKTVQLLRHMMMQTFGLIDAVDDRNLSDLIELCEKAKKYKWHDLTKNPDDLPEQREVDFEGTSFSMSDFVLTIPNSYYDADIFVPRVSRLFRGEWEYGPFCKDFAAFWCPLPKQDEIESQIRSLTEGGDSE